MQNTSPSPSEPNGRDNRGRFAPGNHAGKGNPLAKHVGQLRSALINGVSAEDMYGVVQQLITAAKNGDTAASKHCAQRPNPVREDLANDRC